ncbi:hypothetical protein LTR85_004768 [Meristemomyces frigidus]|nr:hypothetical protein LTR85_004768 [Meristemomyces frigidus]
MSAPTIKHPALKAAVLADAKEKLAGAWAAFKLTAETTTADEIEKIGKKRFGEEDFAKAMAVAEEVASKKAEETAKMIFA